MPQAVGFAVMWAVGLSSYAGATLAVGGIATGITVGSIVGTVVITAASIAVQSALAPGLPNPEAGAYPIKQTTPPCVSGYGRARPQLSYMCYEVGDGKSYDIYAAHLGKIGGFIGYYLHDDVVTIDGSGWVRGLADGRYGRHGNGVVSDLVKIVTRLGLPTETAYAEAVADLPGIWTNDHRGDGVASAMVRCTPVKLDEMLTRFPHGIPVLSVVADMAPVCDLTDPAQIVATPSTWTVSSNPPSQLRDFLTNSDRGGLGLDHDFIIGDLLDDWRTEADYCDELVGAEKRYQSAGWYFHQTDPAETIGAILQAMDGWLCPSGHGPLILRSGRYEPATVTITQDHIYGVSYSRGVPKEQAVNEIVSKFCSPEHDYKMVDVPTFRDEDGIEERGEILSEPIDYPWVQSSVQVRRLQAREMSRRKSALRGQTTTDFAGMEAWGERYVRLQHGFPSSVADIEVEIDDINLDIQGRKVIITWHLSDPDIDDEPDAVDAPTVPDRVALEGFAAPENLDAEQIAGVDGIAVRISADDPEDDSLGLRISWRQEDDGSGDPGPWSEADFADPTIFGGLAFVDLFNGIAEGDNEFIAAWISAGGALSEWSDPPVSVAASLGSVQWTTPAYAAGDFTGSVSMTWAVDAGDVAAYRWTVVGKTMTVQFSLSATSVGGTPSYALQIAVPGGYTPSGTMVGSLVYVQDNGTVLDTGYCDVTVAGKIRCFKNTALAVWTAATNNTAVQGFISFEID